MADELPFTTPQGLIVVDVPYKRKPPQLAWVKISVHTARLMCSPAGAEALIATLRAGLAALEKAEGVQP